MKLTIHTDGGARGNPGPAAVGVVIEKVEDGKLVLIAEWGKAIGDTTNNVAEYTGVIEALLFVKGKFIKRGEVESLDFFLDSTLVVNQIKGLFKVKQPHLLKLLMEVHTLEQEVGFVTTYTSVPREQNSRADFFVNKALDELH